MEGILYHGVAVAINDRQSTRLNYAAPASSAPLPPAYVAILLCVPMLLVGFLVILTPLRPVIPLPSYRSFWIIRAFAMLCALISIILFCDHRVKRRPWFVRLNLLVNLPGLAACTFGVLRYVVINIPPPN
jgi:hypothetical protein